VNFFFLSGVERRYASDLFDMITYEKLSIYARYNGSNDLFLRMGSEQEHKTLTRND